MRHHALPRLLPALLVAAVLASACGGSAPSAAPAGTGAKPAASKAATAKLASVKVAGFPATAQNWPLYIGQAQGYFKQAGIDFSFTAIRSSPNTMQALLTGAIDLANNEPDALFSAVTKNGPVAAIVAGDANVAPYAVVTVPSIHSLKQLKGKTIGGTVLTSSVTYLLRQYLKREAGLAYNDYKFLAVGSTAQRVQALESGQVQAALVAQPQEFAAEAKGYRNVGYVSDVLPAVGDTLIANTKWAKANSATLVRFLKALHESVRWLYDPANKAAAINLLVQRTNTSKLYATKTYDLYVTKLHTFPVDGTIPAQNVQILIDLISAQGGLPKPAPKASTFEDFSYNTQANQG